MKAIQTTVKVAGGGRVVIPVEVRERLGFQTGTELILTVEGDHATLISAKAARQRAKERVRQFISPERSLAQELMAERKAEAANE